MAKILRVKSASTTAPDKAEAAPKKAKAAKKDTPSKFLGRTTGMRVMAFQDKLMRENFKAKFTDETLAQKMRDEFPMAAKFTVAHVKGIRSQFNHGKRASQDGVPPAKPLTEFDAAGTPIVRGAGGGKKPVIKGKATLKAAKPVKVGKKKAAPVSEEEEDGQDDI